MSLQRMRCLLLSSVIGLLFFIGCNSDDASFEMSVSDGVQYAQNSGSAESIPSGVLPVQFELEQTFGANDSPPEAIFNTIWDLDVDANGNVYVLDWPEARIVAFAPNGDVRWTINRQGEGPGDLQQSGSIALTPDGRLLVSNQADTRIDVFQAEDGAYLETHPFDHEDIGRSSIVGTASSSRVVTRTSVRGTVGGNVHIFELGDSLSHQARFFVDEADGKPLDNDIFSINTGFRVVEDTVWAGNFSDYTIRAYDLDGDLQREISRDVEYMIGAVVEESDEGISLNSSTRLYPPIQLSSGHWMTYSHWITGATRPEEIEGIRMSDTEDFSASLDFFNESGRYLGSMTEEGRRVPEIGEPLRVGPRGKLYTYSEVPYPQVRRYQVYVE